MILFSHKNDSSSLFYLLPLEIISYVFVFFSKPISEDSVFLYKDYLTNRDIFSAPSGIALRSKNDLYFSDDHTVVHIFGKDLSSVNRFGKSGSGDGEFDGASGIAISNTGDKIYVCDTDQDRVQIFDKEGSFLSKFGTRGKKNGMFKYPYFLAVSENENLFVSDCSNHRVQVMKEDGEFLYSIGKAGKQLSEFREPRGIAISQLHNQVYVSDYKNHRVQVFSPQGRYIFAFGTSGSKKEIFNPFGICVDEDGNIFNADFDNSCVQVFDGYGNFLLCFGTPLLSYRPQMEYPSDVAVDEEGTVYVANTLHRRLVQTWKTK